MTDTVRVAILRRGQVYYLGERRFDLGIPNEVSAAEEAHLSEYAVDRVTVSANENEVPEVETRAKFEFSDMAEDRYAELVKQRKRGAGPTLLRAAGEVTGDGLDGTAGPRISAGRSRRAPSSVE